MSGINEGLDFFWETLTQTQVFTSGTQYLVPLVLMVFAGVLITGRKWANLKILMFPLLIGILSLGAVIPTVILIVFATIFTIEVLSIQTITSMVSIGSNAIVSVAERSKKNLAKLFREHKEKNLPNLKEYLDEPQVNKIKSRRESKALSRLFEGTENIPQAQVHRIMKELESKGLMQNIKKEKENILRKSAYFKASVRNFIEKHGVEPSLAWERKVLNYIDNRNKSRITENE